MNPKCLLLGAVTRVGAWDCPFSQAGRGGVMSTEEQLQESQAVLPISSSAWASGRRSGVSVGGGGAAGFGTGGVPNLLWVWEAQEQCSRECRAGSRHGRTATFPTLPGITSPTASLPQKLFHTFYKCVTVNKLPLWVKKLCQCKKPRAVFYLSRGEVHRGCAGLLSCLCMRNL